MSELTFLASLAARKQAFNLGSAKQAHSWDIDLQVSNMKELALCKALILLAQEESNFQEQQQHTGVIGPGSSNSRSQVVSST